MKTSGRVDPLEAEPIVILAMLSFSAATTPCATVLEGLTSQKKHAIAVSTSESESVCYRQAWKDTFAVPLLILRDRQGARVEQALSAVAEIAGRANGRAIAILIADGPEVTGYHSDHRDSECARFAEGVHRLCVDSQVFLYSSSWLVRPPRIR